MMNLPEFKDEHRARINGLQSVRFYLTCFATLVSACFIAQVLIQPRWNANGLPSYLGYGKNVEQAAFAFTIVGVGAYVLTSRRPLTTYVFVVWLATVLCLIKAYYVAGMMPKLILFGLAAVVGLYFVWYDTVRDRDCESDGQSTGGAHRVLALVCAAGACWVFFMGITPPIIDLHHSGEVVTSAHNLLQGGVPYRDFFWPHGLSDTGLAALYMKWTGNEGLGVIVFARALTNVFMLFTLLILGWGLLRRPLYAVLAALLLTAFASPGWYPRAPTFIQSSLLPLAALLVLSHRTDRPTLLGIGSLLGFAYLWRIETGVYGLVAAMVYLVFDRYYTRGYAQDGLVGRHLLSGRKALDLALDLLMMGLGAVAVFGLFRILAGFPTLDWFRVTLVDLPRYHRDSTGVPIRMLVNQGGFPLISLPFTMLLALGFYGFTLRKAVERRLPVGTPRDRFFVLVLLYGICCLKSALNRTDAPHIAFGGIVLVLTAFFDVLGGLGEALDRRWVVGPRLRTARGIVVTAAGCLALEFFLVQGFYGMNFPSPFPRGDHLATLQAALKPSMTKADLLTPTCDPAAAELLDGVAQVRELLDAHGVGPRQLLVHHSAAFLYPLLDRELPTRYYCLGWAADVAMERELIEELNQSRVRAFLRVNGIGRSMTYYDVPDSYRIPLVNRYIMSREAEGQKFETKLGILTILADRSEALTTGVGPRESQAAPARQTSNDPTVARSGVTR